jgi:hypothetical protein
MLASSGCTADTEGQYGGIIVQSPDPTVQPRFTTDDPRTDGEDSRSQCLALRPTWILKATKFMHQYDTASNPGHCGPVRLLGPSPAKGTPAALLRTRGHTPATLTLSLSHSDHGGISESSRELFEKVLTSPCDAKIFAFSRRSREPGRVDTPKVLFVNTHVLAAACSYFHSSKFQPSFKFL